MKILTIPGSLRSGSYNMALARAARELAPAGIDLELYDDLGMLPPFDVDADSEEAPAAVRALRQRIADADGVFFVTPEYNGSIPGVLKNAIDWASRPRGEAALRGKTVAVAGASPGQHGAVWAQQDLRRVLGIAGARVVGGDLPVSRAHEVFDRSGRLTSVVIAERLRSHLEVLASETAPAVLAA